MAVRAERCRHHRSLLGVGARLWPGLSLGRSPEMSPAGPRNRRLGKDPSRYGGDLLDG